MITENRLGFRQLALMYDDKSTSGTPSSRIHTNEEKAESRAVAVEAVIATEGTDERKILDTVKIVDAAFKFIETPDEEE